MKANGKEIPWWPSWLMAGICLTSICLSLVCLAHLLFMQNHSCGCVKHSEASYKERGESPVIATASSPLNSMENLSQQRQRRNVVQNPGSFSLYQLQTQIMMIETRFRLLQEEVKRRQGTLGRRGPSGPPGRAGRDGMDGRPGMDGPMGLPGRDGHDGKDGSPGPSGPPGPPGVNGLQGARGERGIKGEPGPMGDKGEIGLPGPKGDRGPRGEAGENGEPGVSGRSGAKGEKGSSGEAKCYVTENGRRFPKPCYLAAHASSDSDLNGHTKTSSGVIFYRWGRTACPQGSTEIYSGQAGSVTHGTRRPGGSEYKCIPSKPWYFGQRDQSSPIRNATTISVEGEGALRASQYYLTCVACLSSKHSIQIMLPARKECYRKWHRQYDGFLAVQVNRGDQKQLVCIDRDARALFDTPDYIMALRADCNTFSCPPFTNSERLPCVVCTM